MKRNLIARGVAGELFGRVRDDGLVPILGNLEQSVFGEPAYPSIEAKAAHLLYFTIKNHPFSDGNKRIGSFLFVDFLNRNARLFRNGEPAINDIGLAALALLVAESDPKDKDVYQRSRRVIWVGFLCLALSAAVFWAVSLLPGEATWEGYAGQAAYVAILGGMSSGGNVLASLLGYLTGSFTNSYTLAKMKIWTGGRWLWTRTIGSTLVGQLVDTVVFVLVACLFGVFPWSLFLTLVLTNYIFKCGVEVLMTPVTYLVVNHLKRVGRRLLRLRDEFYPVQSVNFCKFKI